MRSPKRIPEMIEVLQKLWEKHPDLRLGQLIVNLGAAATKRKHGDANLDPFYVEDGDMLDSMLRALDEPPSLPPKQSD